MRSLAPRTLVACAACIVALSCGGVPTLAYGIAYISTIILPSPAVAVGDTMRDSLGNVAPLRIVAVGRGNDTITSISPTFLVSSVPVFASINSSGVLTAMDTALTIQVVARLGTSLQTTPSSIDIVLQPDSLGQTSNRDSVVFDTTTSPKTNPLAVTAFSHALGAAAAVKSIIVRFQITRVFPANATAGLADSVLSLVDDQTKMLTTSGRTAVDTTDATGLASRRVRAMTTLFDSLEVVARATNLRGVALAPDTFVVVRRP
jgi:hypothetical protein